MYLEGGGVSDKHTVSAHHTIIENNRFSMRLECTMGFILTKNLSKDAMVGLNSAKVSSAVLPLYCTATGVRSTQPFPRNFAAMRYSYVIMTSVRKIKGDRDRARRVNYVT